MLHNAGHCLSYKQLLTVTTGLAEHVLKNSEEPTGAVFPPNLVHGKFVHFAMDNIDILDESLDGKNTFHATQVRFHSLQRSLLALIFFRQYEPLLQLSSLGQGVDVP